MSSIVIAAENLQLMADLTLPSSAKGLVIFAHGSGSNRHSPRNQWVAKQLNQAGLATLLLDLLTQTEAVQDSQRRFDIPRLAQRLVGATQWASTRCATHNMPIAYFGASTGAGAALIAAAMLQDQVKTIVSRGGRPDLAGDALTKVRVPVLLIAGGNDPLVIQLNQQAQSQLTGICQMTLVPGAGHLFSEPGALEQVAALATDWYLHYL